DRIKSTIGRSQADLYGRKYSREERAGTCKRTATRISQNQLWSWFHCSGCHESLPISQEPADLGSEVGGSISPNQDSRNGSRIAYTAIRNGENPGSQRNTFSQSAGSGFKPG